MNRWRAEYDDGIWRFYRDRIEPPFSVKGDIVVDALNKAEARIAELEHRNKVLEDACEMLRKENGRVTQLLDFWKRLSTNGSKARNNLETYIAELEAAQRWIPVSERLPEIGVRVLFYNNFIKNIHKGWYSGDEWVSEIGVFYNGDKLKRITHWMPLPKFPEVQE